MQKQITTHKGDIILLIEVPKDAHSFRDKFSYEGGYWLVMFEPRIEPYLALQSVRVEGNSSLKFELIGTSSTLNDKDVEPFVESKTITSYIMDEGLVDSWVYKNYLENDAMFELCCDQCTNSLESWNSLLEANNIDTNKNYCVLKLKND